MTDREKIIDMCLVSWQTEEGTERIEDLLSWVDRLNRSVKVEIVQTEMGENDFWFYDNSKGMIRNQNNSFFSICGLESHGVSQPVILQNEIGYLGIICRPINGVLHFLMQAKIEPGNINKIQISPTIQATKSNFTQAHGGSKPPYTEYFIDDGKYYRLVDQIQSEQSSRFLGKRNRNTVIFVEESDKVEIKGNYKWMTLGQIKLLMRYDNLVNMDSRTVISCIPFYEKSETDCKLSPFIDKLLKGKEDSISPVYTKINNIKMFSESKRKLVPLNGLSNWHWENGAFVCSVPADFSVIYCDIAIEGREVRHWRQPLLKASGSAVFGLAFCEKEDGIYFLIRIKEETGCFDVCELGPTIQTEPTKKAEDDMIGRLFFKYVNEGLTVFDGYLSEEGGRFFHEQNRNILLKCNAEDFGELPSECFWLNFRTLNRLTQINNILNIQLRNLLSLIPADL